jgi:hypothetical protein
VSFSLRTLFLATAIAALGVAALVAQTRVWTSIFVGVGLVIVVAATIVAVCRRQMVSGVSSAVAWLYIAVVFSFWFPTLHSSLPTTALLIESWWSWQSEKYGEFAAQPAVVEFTKDSLYDPTYLSGLSGFAMPEELKNSFLFFYVPGQMFFTLIFATIAGLFAAFLARPRRTE